MPVFDFVINALIVPQTMTMSCWAAAGATLLGWKNHVPYSERTAAQTAGKNFEIAFDANTGVLSPEIAEFARVLKLTAEPPQSFTADGWDSMLRKHGLLWAGSAIFGAKYVYRHVRVMRGIRGDGSADGTVLLLLDPDGGRNYTVSLRQFAEEIEEIARQDIGANAPTLLPQVLHF